MFDHVGFFRGRPVAISRGPVRVLTPLIASVMPGARKVWQEIASGRPMALCGVGSWITSRIYAVERFCSLKGPFTHGISQLHRKDFGIRHWTAIVWTCSRAIPNLTCPSQPIRTSGFVQVAVYKNSEGTPHLIGSFVYFDGPGKYLDLTVSAPPKFLGRENLVNIVTSYVSLSYSIEPDNVTQLLGVVPLDVWNND